MLLLGATLCPEIATSYQEKSWFSAKRVSPSRRQEEAANVSITRTLRHARAEALVARAHSSPPYQASTAPRCDAWEGGARPRSCSSLPSSILHTHTHPQEFLPSRCAPGLVEHRASASDFVWTRSRAAAVEETGSASSWRCSSMVLSARRAIRGGSAAPLPLGDGNPKETQLLAAISKHPASRAALCKREGPPRTTDLLHFCPLMNTRPLPAHH